MATSTTRRAPLGPHVSVAIFGAGVAGLTTALGLARQGFQDIRVYESARRLGEVGAGINIAPNVARVFKRLDILEYATSRATALEQYKVIESETDEELSHTSLAYLEKDYGTPFYVVHRKDMQGALLSGCERHPAIQFFLGTTVLQVDYTPTSEGKTRFLIKRGKNAKQGLDTANGVEDKEEVWLEADVIVAADGIRSTARKCMLALEDEEDKVEDTGSAAYRILLSREQMETDPELAALINGKSSHRWIGEKRHIIAYPIAGNTIYNLSTAHPDIHFSNEPSALWTSTSGTKAELLETFKDFCPRVQKMLNMVDEDGAVLEWRLRVHLPLRTWVEGNVCLTGDAAHSTLPHLAQGAAQAVEDGATLAVVLSMIDKKEDIHKALLVYEAMRKSRAEFAVATAASNGKGLHVSKSRADRKAMFQKLSETTDATVQGEAKPNVDKQVDKDVQEFLYGYDVAAETEKKFAELFATVGKQ